MDVNGGGNHRSGPELMGLYIGGAKNPRFRPELADLEDCMEDLVVSDGVRRQ